MDNITFHYALCDEQPDTFPCICSHLEDEKLLDSDDLKAEAAFTGELHE